MTMGRRRGGWEGGEAGTGFGMAPANSNFPWRCPDDTFPPSNVRNFPSMNWYYAASGQQRGPVDDSELSQLVAQGVILSDTLVWNETMANWQTWSSIAPPGALSAPPAGESPPPAVADGELRCSRCQQPMVPGDSLEISGHPVCAACKPILLQQLSEGVVGGSGGRPVMEHGLLSEEEFLARDYSLDAVGSVSEAWALLFGRPAIVCLGCLLLWATFIGVSFGFAILQIIPFVGILISTTVSALLTGAMEAGHANIFIRERRGLPNEVTSGFAFFGPRFWDIVLTHLPQAAFTLVMFGAALALGFGFLFGGLSNFTRGGQPQFPAEMAGVLGIGRVGGLMAVLVFMWVYTHLRFAPILALDKGYSWSAALRLSWRFVGKHFWQNLWLLILGSLVMMVGACACLVGVVVSYPLGYGMVAVVYDRHFRDLAPLAR